MTFYNYLKHYKSVLGVLTAILGALPFVGKLGNVAMIAPPVSYRIYFWYIILLSAIITMTYCLKDIDCIKKKWSIPVIVFCLLLLGGTAIVVYEDRAFKTICSIYIESEGRTDYVIIGTEKTDLAKKEYSTANCEEMLKDYGYKENLIRELYTEKSLSAARLWLIIPYLIGLLSFCEIFSLGVLKSFFAMYEHPEL
ncbi:MAG: hypothetical protein JRD05_08830 [Deltaproteobacteria bacterium]|nr:hypothetical protein [Deltaproteobacteria bacterium]